jgi:hypothetical protein
MEPDSPEFNREEALLNIKAGAEAQKVIDASIQDYINRAPDQVADNLNYVLEVQKEMVKRNMPFMLLVNPHEFSFDFKAKRGYWSFHNVMGNMPIDNPEIVDRIRSGRYNMFSAVMNFIMTVFPGSFRQIPPPEE